MNPHAEALVPKTSLSTKFQHAPHTLQVAGLEPAAIVPKTIMLPNYTTPTQKRKLEVAGVEPTLPVPKTGVLPD